MKMDDPYVLFLTALRYALDKAEHGDQKKCATYAGISTVHFNNCFKERYGKVFSLKLQKKVSKYYSYKLPDFLELGRRLTENIEYPEHGIEEFIDITLPPKELLQKLLKKDARINENELTLATIVSMAPVGIGLVKDRTIAWTNKATAEILGCTVEEITDMPTRKLYHSEQDYIEAGYRIYPIISNGEVALIKPRLKKKDGSSIFVRMHFCTLDKKQLSAGAIFIIIDITKERTLLNQLRQSELLSGTGSFTRNLLTGETYWSDGYKKILGFPDNTEPSFERVVEATHPSYRENFIAVVNGHINDPYCESATFDNLFVNQTTGANRHIKITIQILRSVTTGKAHTFIGSATDATRDKQAETIHNMNEKAMLETIAMVDNPICIHDNKFILEYQNDQHEKIYGNCIGQLCYEVYWGLDEPCGDCVYVRAIKSGKRENKIFFKDGEGYEVSTTPLADENGNYTRALEIVKHLGEGRSAPK
jgi:PAS domain S-box-containing protein